MAIVGNTVDLEEQREVAKQELLELAKSLDVRCFEVSAKTGEGAEGAFVGLARQLVVLNDNETLNNCRLL
jgi:putative ribosome biogenesis GTPase RsgA